MLLEPTILLHFLCNETTARVSITDISHINFAQLYNWAARKMKILKQVCRI